MMTRSEITRVAVVGTGVIGTSWAAYFLAQGLEVIATDPAPGAEDNLRADVARHWHSLTLMGLAPGASQDKLSFSSDLEAAVGEAQFVQENGPERLDIKIDLFRRLDNATLSQVIVASSSSGLMISQVQGACLHPSESPPRPSLQSTSSYSFGRGGWRRRHGARSGQGGTRFLHLDRQTADPPAQGSSGSCRQPPSGGAVARGFSPGRSRRRQRCGYRHGDFPRPWLAVGLARSFSEPAPVRWARRHRTPPGTSWPGH